MSIYTMVRKGMFLFIKVLFEWVPAYTYIHEGPELCKNTQVNLEFKISKIILISCKLICIVLQNKNKWSWVSKNNSGSIMSTFVWCKSHALWICIRMKWEWLYKPRNEWAPKNSTLCLSNERSKKENIDRQWEVSLLSSIGMQHKKGYIQMDTQALQHILASANWKDPSPHHNHGWEGKKDQACVKHIWKPFYLFWW